MLTEKVAGISKLEVSQGVSSSALSCVSNLEVPAIKRHLKVSQALHCHVSQSWRYLQSGDISKCLKLRTHLLSGEGDIYTNVTCDREIAIRM